MTKELAPLRRKDIETGRKLEREAIVKWTREKPSHTMAASAIERGEHLK